MTNRLSIISCDMPQVRQAGDQAADQTQSAAKSAAGGVSQAGDQAQSAAGTAGTVDACMASCCQLH